MSGGASARGALPPAVHRYVAGWVIAGLASITVTVLLLGQTETRLSGDDLQLAAIFFVATALAGGLAVGLRTREGIHRVSFIEAAVVGCLVALHPGWAVLVITAGLVVTELASRRTFVKAAYNVSSFAAATAVAAGITAVIRGGADPLAARGVIGAVVGMVGFGVVNLAAIQGVMRRLRPGLEAKGDDANSRISAFRLSLLGNTAIGILGAAIVDSEHRWLLPLLLVPLATLYLANVGIGRTTALLRRSESERGRLDRIVQGVTDGVASLDASGVVELWSPSMERITGIPSAGAVGARLTDLVVPRVEGRAVDPLEVATNATQEQPSATVAATLERPDGLARQVEFHLTVVFDAGQPDAIVVLLRDVTRERELERAKDDFLMRISHELRTPLTPIRGYAESLRIHRERVTPELLERSLERIEERAVHMTRVVDDLLLVANLGSADATVRSKDLRLLEPVVAVVGRLVQDGRPTTIDVDPEHVVFADRPRLEQIVNALVDNAVRYSPPGGRVTLRSYARPSSVVLEVVDEGRGIPADHLDRVFDRFHRVEDPLTMTTAGVGLGLYLARRLAESMGGALTVRSQVSVGSTFALTLPRGRVEDRAPADEARAEAR